MKLYSFEAKKQPNQHYETYTLRAESKQDAFEKAFAAFPHPGYIDKSSMRRAEKDWDCCCSSCGEKFEADDIDGGRCLKCGSMIIGVSLI